jgi:hypothetical protein
MFDVKVIFSSKEGLIFPITEETTGSVDFFGFV